MYFTKFKIQEKVLYFSSVQQLPSQFTPSGMKFERCFLMCNTDQLSKY